MKKIVIINGRGGVGKDALISEMTAQHRLFLDVLNISSIDPIKKRVF